MSAALNSLLVAGVTCVLQVQHAAELRSFIQRFRTHQLEVVTPTECLEGLRRNDMDVERALEADPKAAGFLDRRYLSGATRKGQTRFCVISSTDTRERRTAQLVTFVFEGVSYMFLTTHPRGLNQLQSFQVLHELGHVSYTTFTHMVTPKHWVSHALASLALPLVLGPSLPVVAGSVLLALYARSVMRTRSLERARLDGESDEIAADLFAIRCAPRDWIERMHPSRARLASLLCETRFVEPRRPGDHPTLATRRRDAFVQNWDARARNDPRSYTRAPIQTGMWPLFFSEGGFAAGIVAITVLFASPPGLARLVAACVLLVVALVALITASLLLRVMTRAADHVLGVREISSGDRDLAERMGWRLRSRVFEDDAGDGGDHPEQA